MSAANQTGINNGESKRLILRLLPSYYSRLNGDVLHGGGLPLPTFTTAQVARLSGKPVNQILSDVARTGSSHGITPYKLSNGRYQWRAEEVDFALGFVPEWNDMTPGERAWVLFLNIEAFPLTAANFKLGQRLLSHEADEGRHPDESVDELSLLYEIVEAFGARADATVPMIGERACRRAKAALALVASRTQEYAAPESEADHD